VKAPKADGPTRQRRTATKSERNDDCITDTRFISTQDCARILGVAESTLRKSVCQGRRENHFWIPYHRIGRAIRYRLDEVLTIASAGRVER